MIKHNLSSDWKNKNFGELFDFEKKSKHKASEGEEKGNYKFFTSSNIQKKFIDDFDFDGDFLVFGTGGSASMHNPVGKFSTSTDCLVAKMNNHQILTKYVYYYIAANMHLLEAGFKGAGLKHISKKYIQSIEINYPDDIEIQKKIVAILEKTERLKDWRKEADELTDEFLKSTFLEMFGDPVTNPKCFDVKKLKDFGKIQTGNTPSRKNSEYYGKYIEWIKSDNINTPNTYLTTSEEMLSKNGAKIGRVVPRASILVTCIAGSLSCIGNVAIADREVAFNQQINAITPNEDINELFLYHLILNTKNYIQNYSTQSMKGMINKSVFESIPLIYPPIDLQQKFTLIAKKVEQLREHQNQSRQHIDDLFNVLMQKAFKGKLM